MAEMGRRRCCQELCHGDVRVSAALVVVLAADVVVKAVSKAVLRRRGSVLGAAAAATGCRSESSVRRADGKSSAKRCAGVEREFAAAAGVLAGVVVIVISRPRPNTMRAKLSPRRGSARGGGVIDESWSRSRLRLLLLFGSDDMMA